MAQQTAGPSPRTAIVTGAAQGIGRAIALRLARDGLAVTLADLATSEEGLRSACEEIGRAGGTCRRATADVSVRADVDGLVADHAAAFGGLDVMVANAGIAVTAGFLDTTPEVLDRTLAINVRGVFHCYQAAAARMIAQGRGGRLIAAGSVSSHRGSDGQCAYVASKFAVRGLNQTAAMELGRYGITANLYSPGVIHTPLWDAIDEAVTTSEGRPRGSHLARMPQYITLRRTGVPEDVVGVVSFLASEDAAYVTGQSIVVDGGIYFV